MTKTIPCLWFDSQGEEAVDFYCSVFRTAKKGDVTRYPANVTDKAGQAMTIAFEIGGVEFVALNGGPQFKFNEAISLQIMCEDQAEVDQYWNAISEAGGEPGPCGWIKDRFGLSWQIVPTVLPRLMSDKDPAKVARVTEAMFQMSKLDVARLQAAADPVPA
jgi:predicted 3-demethylubiquinone-9 3-methyltransferase (glyoxalase superfamily)